METVTVTIAAATFRRLTHLLDTIAEADPNGRGMKMQELIDRLVAEEHSRWFGKDT
jgi:hypothetical protein